jgi:hypothetical protein
MLKLHHLILVRLITQYMTCGESAKAHFVMALDSPVKSLTRSRPFTQAEVDEHYSIGKAYLR